MSIYQSSVLKKHLAGQDEALMQTAFETYSAYFLDAAIQENIRNSKEEQFQEGFLRELFVKVLGYTINPEPNFNLTTELKNIRDAKKTDGAILKDGSALAVIELKGTDTKDLDKVTDQAFNYKNNQPECVYVVTSNFEKLRFYIHHAVEHEEFNLFNLTFDRFKLFWLLLQKDNLLGGIPQKIKEESLLEEEKVTKRLYKDYSAFKNDLWQDMCQHNSDVDELELYKKSQKLLDRFLFIFFAEDKGLLPPNSISVIVEQWKKLKELDEYKPLYERFKKYFGYMNDGFKGKHYEIHAYNGGLFKADPLLDGLNVSDDVLEKHVLKLTEYDFESEVDTNILGHIFEHSLNDIENVRAQLAGEEVDKSKTKRKKDGVFYTPKYITKYIVDNTVGKLCTEKKTEIGIDEEEFAKERKGRRKSTLKKLDAQLKEYRAWLLQLTICDPACGSGAFLNQTLEFLIAEHRYVDELESQLLGYAMVFPDVENHILERNLYGVDINEESVEIARLSLWLRTAQKGRKLTSLSENIKVGNSLIDDPKVAGDLAFTWQEEFPQVFQKGGFDVMIGNPPYVRSRELFNKSEKAYFTKRFETTSYQLDLYKLFIELSLKLLSKKGVLSFITPSVFLTNDYDGPLRKFILEGYSLQKVATSEKEVFQDASVKTVVFVIGHQYGKDDLPVEIYEVNAGNFFLRSEIPQSEFIELGYLINEKVDPTALPIIKKLGEHERLGKLFEVKNGIKVRKELLYSEAKDETFKPFLIGGDIHRYAYTFDSVYVHYLKENEKLYSNQAFRSAEIFERDKLVVRQILGKRIITSLDTKSFYTDQTTYLISAGKEHCLKQLLCILNSKLLYFYFQNTFSDNKVTFPKVKRSQLLELPVRLNKEKSFDEWADLMMNSTSSLRSLSSNFIEFFLSKFPISKPSKKLLNWLKLDFKGFLSELKKEKIKLNLDEEAEWMNYFNKKKAEASALQTEINRIDKRIDYMVYELYGLTEEEIAIVEKH